MITETQGTRLLKQIIPRPDLLLLYTLDLNPVFGCKCIVVIDYYITSLSNNVFFISCYFYKAPASVGVGTWCKPISQSS